MQLKKLKIGTDLHCGTPAQPLLELHPTTDQLVFEGDPLTLRCRAPRVAVGAPNDSEDLPARGHVVWGWSQTVLAPNSTEDIIFHNPAAEFPTIQIIDHARHLADSGLLDSVLRIPSVQRNHSGTWDCRLRSPQQAGNLSRSIAVVIVSPETRFCGRNTTANNKGRYAWPRTIRGHTVRLPCAGDGASAASTAALAAGAAGAAHGSRQPHATFRCSETGAWLDLDTEACPYMRETTKVLEQFARINMSIARGSVLESARRLRNYTDAGGAGAATRFRDAWDVVYLGRTVSNYVEYVAEEKELAALLLELVAQTAQAVRPQLMQRAQELDGTAARLVNATEQAAGWVAAQQAHRGAVAVEQFRVRPETFGGLICTWHRGEGAGAAEGGGEASDGRRTFQCNSGSTADAMGINGNLDAVVQVPANVFRTQQPTVRQLAQTQQQSQQPANAVQRLLVSVFKDAALFPGPERPNVQFEVMSCVIGVKVSAESIRGYGSRLHTYANALQDSNEFSSAPI